VKIDLRLLFSVLGFLLPLGVLIHRVEAFGAIPAEVELRVGRLLRFFGELSLQELPPSLVARSLDFAFQLAQDAFVLFHMSYSWTYVRGDFRRKSATL
jgi:hypothetical protein